MAIQVNPQVQKQLLSRGVDAKVGVFGDHQVRLGEGKPIRLDVIKPASIPSTYCFSKAGKIYSAQNGIDKNAGAALKALTRPGGKLDAGTLLGSLKALHIHCEYLKGQGKLLENTLRRTEEDGFTVVHNVRENTPAERNLRAFAPLVEKLSNEELAAVFQSFMSGEMDLLLTALRHEGQTSADAWAAATALFDVQGLVLKEVSDRVAKGQKMEGSEDIAPLSAKFDPLVKSGAKPGGERPKDSVSSGGLRVLVERSAQSAGQRGKMTGNFNQDMKARNLEGLSARAMGDIMRSSELTLNMDTEFFFYNKGSILHKPDQQMQNIYHLEAKGEFPKGKGYLGPRKVVEQTLFPELHPGPKLTPAERLMYEKYVGSGGVNPTPDERPAYGALNVSGAPEGAAKSYGDVVIVLKPEVARRSTFTVDDTFYNIPTDFSRERRDTFYTLVQALAAQKKIPADFADALKNENSQPRRAFEAFFNAQAQAKNTDTTVFNSWEAHLPSGGLEKEHKDFMMGAFIAAFGLPEAARGRTATWDSLESLLPGMAWPMAGSLAKAALDQGGKPVLVGAQYIEAQIQGGVLLGRDVAKIRIRADILTPEEKEKVRTFAQQNNIPLELHSPLLSDEDAATIYLDKKKEATDFARAHFNPGIVQDAVNELIKDCREQGGHIGGLADSVLKDNALKLSDPMLAALKNFQGRALEGALADFTALVREWRNHPDRIPYPEDMAMATERGMVKEAFEQVFKPVLLAKAALLSEWDSLKFDNEKQKLDFTGWVMGTKAVKSPEDLRMFQAGARECAETLKNVMEENPTAEGLLRGLVSFVAGQKTAMADYLQRRGDERGFDDIPTAMLSMARMAFSFIKHSPNGNGEDLLQKLGGLIYSPEHYRLYEQATFIAGKDWAEQGLLTYLNSFSAALLHVAAEDPQNRRDNPSLTFHGGLGLVPRETRDILSGLAPAYIAQLDANYPALPAFPAPAGPGLPKDESGRRAFLTGALLAPESPGKAPGPYIAHELAPGQESLATHGRGHIARSYIFASAFCNILEEQGVKVDRNAVLLGVAGHDLGRTDGKPDQEKSGTELVKALCQAFGASPGQEYENALKSCLTQQSLTLEAALIKAAVYLDVSRLSDFDMKEFGFLNSPALVSATADVRKKLHEEAVLLQRLTDPYSSSRAALERFNATISNAATDEDRNFWTTERQKALDELAGQYAEMRKETGEALMKRIEETIRNSPDVFPMLTKYYLTA